MSDRDIHVIGRLVPDSGKIHQKQEIYGQNGICCILEATSYKDPESSDRGYSWKRQ